MSVSIKNTRPNAKYNRYFLSLPTPTLERMLVARMLVTMVVFGAAADLTTHKLLRHFINLAEAKLLPKDFAVVGISVDELSREQFRGQVLDS
jgi:glucose-6-phosphate dehydrogenase-like protein